MVEEFNQSVGGWLARIGNKRGDEIKNPEPALGSMTTLDEKKAYPKEWIDKHTRILLSIML